MQIMPPRFIIFYVLPLPHSPLHTPPAACSAHPRPMPRAPSTSHRTHLTTCHALFRPSSHTLSPLVTHSPVPRHTVSHPSSRTLPPIVTHSPSPCQTHTIIPLRCRHNHKAPPPNPHPFAKRPISPRETAHFATRFGPF